jgi:hypothetical protein
MRVAVILVDEQRRLPVVTGEHGVGQGLVYLRHQAGLIEAGLVLVKQLNQQRAGVRLRHRKPDLPRRRPGARTRGWAWTPVRSQAELPQVARPLA